VIRTIKLAVIHTHLNTPHKIVWYRHRRLSLTVIVTDLDMATTTPQHVDGMVVIAVRLLAKMVPITRVRNQATTLTVWTLMRLIICLASAVSILKSIWVMLTVM
jgi:hypothetical protein